MPNFSRRVFLISASLFTFVLAGCGGGGGGAGGSSNSGTNGPAAPALSSIPRVISDDFKLSPLFTNGAVLQRDRPLPIWGSAAPGENITVELAGRTAQTVAGSDGHWMTSLSALGAGGPYVLNAKTAGGQTLTRSDILLGDVWLCSGQSNMEMSFEWNVKNKTAEVAAANYPNIRLLKLPQRGAWSPQSSFDASWQVCRPDTVRPFSAAAYFFGRELNQKTGVPIGLIDAAWAATPAQSWVSAGGLQNLGEFRSPLSQNLETSFLDRLNRWWRDNDAGTRGDWSRQSFDDSTWKTASLPNNWSAAGITETVGVVWLRLTVNVPATLAGRDLNWHAGTIGGADTAFWNGSLVGQNVERGKARTYIVPGALVKAGPNQMALRVADKGNGGIGGDLNLSGLDKGGAPIVLNGIWKYRVTMAPGKAATMPTLGSIGAPTSNNPTIAYNGLIAPLQPLGLKGVFWYQGEANKDKASGYQSLLTALIGDWRAGFNNPDLPFIIAQLANYGAPDESPTDGALANLQWAQNRVATNVSGASLVVLNDIGEVAEQHPANKQDVGKRASLWALKNQYGQNVTASGPILQRFATQNNEMRLTFANADGGLRLEGDSSHVFAVAGGNGQFVWAMPRIEANEIVLSAPGVSNPKNVRFAWSGTPRGTLYNGANLPASLFATDK